MPIPTRYSKRLSTQSDHFRQSMIRRVQTVQGSFEDYDENQAGLAEQFIHAFEQEITNELIIILNSQNIETELVPYLKKVWAQISGTLLCYTSRPTAELTQIVCALCEHFATPEQPAIKLLMPDVLIEDMRVNQPAIADQSLPEILKTHILSESGRYLIPIAVLNEITLPISPQLKLPNYCYDVDATPEESGFITKNELKRLFQHSELTKTLKQCAKEYILNLDPKSLLFYLYDLIDHLHVNSVLREGAEEDAAVPVYDSIRRFNDYYKALGDLKKNIPTPVANEIQFLLDISSQYKEERNLLDTCLNERRTSLSNVVRQHVPQLAQITLAPEHHQNQANQAKEDFILNQQHLVRQLKRRVYSGQDTVSNKDLYLNKDQVKPKIYTIEDLKVLFNLPAKQTLNWLRNDDDLATQCAELFISTDELLLFAIQYDDQHLEIAIKKIMLRIDANDGNSSMLSTLNSEQRFRVYQLVTKKRNHSAIAMDFPDDLMFSLFTNLFYELLFKDLPLKEQETLYHKLKPLWLAQPAKHTHLGIFIKSLNKDLQSDLVHALIQSPRTLRSFVPDIHVFSTLTEHLDANLRDLLFNELMKDSYLLNLINTLEECNQVLERLTGVDRLSFIQSHYDKIQILLKECDNAEAIGKLIKHLNPEQRSQIFNELFSDPKAVIDLINSADDFYDILGPFKPFERLLLFRAIDSKEGAILNLIQNANDFAAILKFLPLAEKEILLDKIINRLPHYIEDGYDYINIAAQLPIELRSQVYEASKHKLAGTVDTAREFCRLLEFLPTKETRSFIFNQINNIEELIVYSDDFKWVLKYLAPNERSQVFDRILEQEPMFYECTCQEAYENICKYLNPAERAKVTLIIQNANCDFTPMFNLTQQQQSANNDITTHTMQSISSP